MKVPAATPTRGFERAELGLGLEGQGHPLGWCPGVSLARAGPEEEVSGRAQRSQSQLTFHIQRRSRSRRRVFSFSPS